MVPTLSADLDHLSQCCAFNNIFRHFGNTADIAKKQKARTLSPCLLSIENCEATASTYCRGESDDFAPLADR